MSFILNLNTEIENPCPEPPIANAVSILLRDMEKTLVKMDDIHNSIILVKDSFIEEETFLITARDEGQLIITAGDSLGFIYGLLYISQTFLQIQPFWFWLDQKIEKPGSVLIPEGTYTSPVPAVRYRGWFLNDEVLLIHWNNGQDREFPWRMAFEALLRCGGNMVIPGQTRAAASMQIWPPAMACG